MALLCLILICPWCHTTQITAQSLLSGSHSWSQRRDSWRDAEQIIHEERCAPGTGHFDPTREASCCAEIWARGWSNKNPAGDWQHHGCEQGANSANRVWRISETKEQEKGESSEGLSSAGRQLVNHLSLQHFFFLLNSSVFFSFRGFFTCTTYTGPHVLHNIRRFVSQE